MRKLAKLAKAGKALDLEARQAFWERRQKALEMRRKGATFKAIGVDFGVTPSRAAAIVFRAEMDLRRPSPLEQYRKLIDKMQKREEAAVRKSYGR